MNQLFLLRSFYCLFLTLLSKSANKLGENNIKHSCVLFCCKTQLVKCALMFLLMEVVLSIKNQKRD